jgi:hypothetical protein
MSSYFQRLLTLWGDGWYEEGKAAEAIQEG